METRSPHERRRLLSWIAVLAMVAASCSASTTVDQSTTEADSTESTSQADSPVDGDDGSTTTDPNDDADSADDSTGAPAVEPTPAPTLAPVDDAPDDEAAEDEAADDEAAVDEAPDDDAPDDTETAAPDSSDGEVVVGEARVVVLDPGAEPRTKLRLLIAATCTEVMTLTTVQELSQTIGGQPIPSAGPIGNIMEMATSATPVGDNYEIRAEVLSAIAGPDTPPELATTINSELSQIVGLTSYATLTNRGVQVPGSSRVEGAEVLGPMASLVEGLNQSQAPLPEEAVGVGAKWETTGVLELEGLLVTTIVTNEIISMDGTVVELSLSGRQEVDPDSRMTTQGITGEVTLWDVTTTGTTIIDLATINPISSTLSTTGVQGFDFGDGGELEQEIFTEILIEAQPNDGCTGRTIRG